MPCHTRMKIILLQGLLWLYLLGFGFMVTSLEPGYLDFDNLPDTNFTCVGKVIGGYYADLETSCQMFHVCTIGQLDEPMDIRFLCLNGTVFDQETRVCERIDEVDCSKSEQFYSLNLELYGNTQPPILEESSETDPPEILKQPSTTTTTTTTPRPTKPKTTRQSFIITTHKPATTSDKFRLSNSADIRFNPEEFNIKLNHGAPPNIRQKPISFQQFGDNNKRVIVTTHTNLPKTEEKPPVSYRRPTEDYSYNNYQTERNDYQTEIPQPYHYRPSNFRPTSRDVEDDYKPSTYRSIFNPTTHNPLKLQYEHRGPTTYRNHAYSAPLKPSQPYYHRTDKPPRIQLPLIPTIAPITFSSPAPFSLNRHIETKRFADHHQPPRIVISASASVSDASGRKFNYSLGTIGDSRLFGQAPTSYDDYKEDDVSLDPFYHDVPKLTRVKRRNKRQAPAGNDKEAIDVLKFLFDWYSKHEKTTAPSIAIPIKSETITEINEGLTPENPIVVDDYLYDELDVNQTKPEFVHNLQILKPPHAPPKHEFSVYDYVDDNYEAVTHPPITENYSQVLKILGVTTKKSATSSRGKKKFTLDDDSNTELPPFESTRTIESRVFNVPKINDVLTTTTTTTTTAPIVQTTHTTSEVNTVAQTQPTIIVEATTTTEAAATTLEAETTPAQHENFITTTPTITSTISKTPEKVVLDDGEFYSTTNALYTTIQLQKFIQEVEQSTKSMGELGNEAAMEVTTFVPLTTYANTESATKLILETTTPASTVNNNVEEATSTTTTYKPPISSRRHRFGPTRKSKRPSINEEIVDVIKNKMEMLEEMRLGKEMSDKKIEFNINAYTANLAYRNQNPTHPTLAKSANPTLPKDSKDLLPTTPLTKTITVNVNRQNYNQNYIFNCFDRAVNRFYSDPRDCRLFHYCSKGFTKTQLLDMKFVCDLGTFFDDEKLICTKTKPARCR